MREGLRAIAREDPGHADDFAGAERLGLEVVPVPIDEHGIDVGALANAGVGAAVLTPAHQSPTGVVLGPERRRELIEWAVRRSAIVIEDDYDAEFRYDRDPVGAVQGLAPERVALVGTVSKSLAPALRMGWIVCPPSLVEAVAEQKTLHDRGSPGLEQLALASLIESGRYDKHLRRMRTTYSGKRQALVDALEQHAPSVRLGGLAAGFHGVARLEHGIDEIAAASAARERSIGIYPMSNYRSPVQTRAAEIVLGFGNLSHAAIKRGIATISDLLEHR
jgi:GntR family transcriptional regulator/MocR family aminotransferase